MHRPATQLAGASSQAVLEQTPAPPRCCGGGGGGRGAGTEQGGLRNGSEGPLRVCSPRPLRAWNFRLQATPSSVRDRPSADPAASKGHLLPLQAAQWKSSLLTGLKSAPTSSATLPQQVSPDLSLREPGVGPSPGAGVGKRREEGWGRGAPPSSHPGELLRSGAEAF